jgi:hypothetical protein
MCRVQREPVRIATADDEAFLAIVRRIAPPLLAMALVVVGRTQ